MPIHTFRTDFFIPQWDVAGQPQFSYMQNLPKKFTKWLDSKPINLEVSYQPERQTRL
jgi:hypothetical protein